MMPPRVLFLGLAYAGHRTRFMNLRAHTQHDPRVRPMYRQVTGWEDGGLIEGLPLLPHAVRGRMRATLQAAPLASLPRPDAIWTSVIEVAVPYLWAQLGGLRRPLVYDLDSTLEQMDAFSPLYYGRPSRVGAGLVRARLFERAFWSRVSLFTPWSRWAADSLRRQGVSADRICLLPPGVDLGQWSPKPRPPMRTSEPLRLLFVGGDFLRKGGHFLLEVLKHTEGRYEADIVTHDEVAAQPGVRVHRAEPNSMKLLDLFARADLFVLPTQAECFGIAAVEALASGVPVIMGDVGGARDIVDEAETGWLIQPTAPALATALARALAERDRLPAMGRRGREITEQRFDGARNDARILDLVVQQAAEGQRSRRGRGWPRAA